MLLKTQHLEYLERKLPDYVNTRDPDVSLEDKVVFKRLEPLNLNTPNLVTTSAMMQQSILCGKKAPTHYVFSTNHGEFLNGLPRFIEFFRVVHSYGDCEEYEEEFFCVGIDFRFHGEAPDPRYAWLFRWTDDYPGADLVACFQLYEELDIPLVGFDGIEDFYISWRTLGSFGNLKKV